MPFEKNTKSHHLERVDWDALYFARAHTYQVTYLLIFLTLPRL